MFIPLKNILSRHIRQSGINRQVEAARSVEIFHEIIGEMFGKNILKRARATSLRNKVLAISCLSSVATQEIYLRREKIIRELNKRLGEGTVERLKFKM